MFISKQQQKNSRSSAIFRMILFGKCAVHSNVIDLNESRSKYFRLFGQNIGLGMKHLRMYVVVVI